jgi:hypothetical protein
LVSKNALAGIGLVAVEDEAGRQGTSQIPQSGQCILAAAIPLYLECAITYDSDLDLITFLQIKGVNNS